jgi:hypothetical protein
MAGYSATPLIKKLGISEGTTAIALNAPANYRRLLGPLPAGARILDRVTAPCGFVHLFVTTRANLEKRLGRLRKQLAEMGTLWVSWPKKSARVPTDVTEDVIRAVALPLGLVDIKVCAVDETWSALKLMIRRELRISATKKK